MRTRTPVAFASALAFVLLCTMGAAAFAQAVPVTGVVLTKLDGDTRGGAALSIKETTGAPIKLAGVGEKVKDLEVFHPDRMASRIIGMGDVMTLIEKAQETVSREEAEKLAKKLRRSEFTLEDFRDQLRQVKKMGSLESIIGMIPGMNRLPANASFDEKALVRVEAIIQSMTAEERQRPNIINGTRRRRIALGSGTSIQEVNKVMKQFGEMQKMVKKFSRGGNMQRMMRGMKLPAGL